jgi:hypothetical protein
MRSGFHPWPSRKSSPRAEDFRAVLVETLTDEPLKHTVYVRERVIFLKSGLWWRVPNVTIRLIYDTRGMGQIDLSQAHFQDLCACYSSGPDHEHKVVEGLEAKLHRAAQV